MKRLQFIAAAAAVVVAPAIPAPAEPDVLRMVVDRSNDFVFAIEPAGTNAAFATIDQLQESGSAILRMKVREFWHATDPWKVRHFAFNPTTGEVLLDEVVPYMPYAVMDEADA